MNRIGVTGHQELSLSTERFVTNKIKQLLVQYDSLVGISCLAAGVDQLFTRLVLALNGTLEIIIPARDYRETFTNNDDRAAYDTLLTQAAKITVLPFAKSSEDAFMAAGQEVVRRCNSLIAVWDGQPSRGKGGTADIVRYAKDNGVPISIVWPVGATRD